LFFEKGFGEHGGARGTPIEKSFESHPVLAAGLLEYGAGAGCQSMLPERNTEAERRLSTTNCFLKRVLVRWCARVGGKGRASPREGCQQQIVF
jgi:hypothetical protein